MKSQKNWIAAIILLVYFVIKFGFTQWLDSLGENTSYIFELAVVVLIGFFYKKNIVWNYKVNASILLDTLFPLVAGFGILALTKPLGLAIPFDMQSKESLLMLALLGPILEELIFRMAIWEVFTDFLRKFPIAVLVFINSLIFAYAHFHAYWFVPKEIYGFIFYQTSYVFLLSLYLGYRKVKTGSQSANTLAHIFFNIGFGLGYFTLLAV